MNNVSLIGRLTADPEMRKTQNDKSVLSFSIAVNNPHKKDEVFFIRVVAFGTTAEFITRYFSKGDRIGVIGYIKSRNYVDKDSVNRTSFEVVADMTYFCEAAKKND